MSTNTTTNGGTLKGAAAPVYDDVLLARISMASGREHETSTTTQVEEMTTYSQDTGGRVVATFYERGKSGYKANVRRDDLERAVRMIETGQANRLVIWKIDRLMRNVRRFQDVMNRIERAGGQVVSKSESWMDTTTPIGYGIVGMVAAIAEQESRDRAVRITPWHGVRKREGMTPGGQRPYGYERGRNTLTIIPTEAKVIREAARRIIKGEALRGIATDFNRRGIPAKDVREGEAPTVWNHTRVKRVVTNPTTAAKRTMKDGTFRDSPHWKPILDDATWTRCREILFAPERRMSTHTELTHFLSGALTCGKPGCNGVLRGRTQNTRIRYTCAKCNNSIDAPETEAFLSGYLLSKIDPLAWQALRARGRMTDTTALDRMRKALDHERSKWLDGTISDAEWDDAQRDVKARMERMQTAPVLELPDVESLHDSWATMEPHDKRLTIMAVFDSVTVNPRAKGINGTERIEARTNPKIAA